MFGCAETIALGSFADAVKRSGLHDKPTCFSQNFVDGDSLTRSLGVEQGAFEGRCRAMGLLAIKSLRIILYENAKPDSHLSSER